MGGRAIVDDAPTFDTRASLNGEAFDYSLSEALKNGMAIVVLLREQTSSINGGGCS